MTCRCGGRVAPICAKMMPDDSPLILQLIGSPRHWCGKSRWHEGECGEWEYGSQPEHVEALNRGYK
jgi:hypothetical protein